MRPELRIGHSYMLSAEHGALWQQARSLPAFGEPLHQTDAWSKTCSILLPLRGTADRLVGILSVGNPADGQIPSRDVIGILEILANQAAVAIENARLYQALQKAYETKGEFLSLVAHELQVPMTTLWGYTDLLDQEGESVDLESLRGFARVLKTNIARLEALVHDLLEVSRIEAGSFQLNLIPLDASEVVLESIATFRPRIQRRGLELVHDAPLGLPPALADRDRLTQVLDNLLSNACKYTPTPGSIDVSTRVLRQIADLDGSSPVLSTIQCPCILITVQDTGIGLSPQEQKQVFTRFFRGEDSVVRQEEGTGLGLYLVRLLVEAQGGQVWVESEAGQGSRFHVALPLAAPEQA